MMKHEAAQKYVTRKQVADMKLMALGAALLSSINSKASISELAKLTGLSETTVRRKRKLFEEMNMQLDSSNGLPVFDVPKATFDRLNDKLFSILDAIENDGWSIEKAYLAKLEYCKTVLHDHGMINNSDTLSEVDKMLDDISEELIEPEDLMYGYEPPEYFMKGA